MADRDKIEDELKEIELALKRKELEQARRSFSLRDLNPVIVAIIAALLGFLGNVVATYFQGRNALTLEREKQQGALVIESIKTGNPDNAARNLEFLIEAGLLRDPDSRIRQYLNKKGSAPVLPAALFERVIGQPIDQLLPDDSYRSIASAVGEVQGPGTKCSATLIAEDRVLTPSFCVDQADRLKVFFGYISQASKPLSYSVHSIEEVNDNLHYAILRLHGKPGLSFGVIKPRPAGKLLIGDSVAVIYHSQNVPLTMCRGQIVGYLEDVLHYECETGPGAAGGPVFNSQLELIAMHLGDVGEEATIKEGVRIGSLIRESAMLKNISEKSTPQR